MKKLFLIILSVVYAVSIVFSNEYDMFVSWFERNGGIKSSKITLKDIDNLSYGRGIVAVDDIRHEELLLSVPYNMVICLDSMSIWAQTDSVYQQILQVFQHHFNNDLSVGTALLYEKYKGSQSFFYEYIQVLPDYVPNLSYFSDKSLNELQDADIASAAKSHQNNLIKSFSDLKKLAKNIFTSDIYEKLTYEEFLWAMSIIDSRGLRFKGKVYLVPFADMFNHRSNDTKRDASNGDVFLKYHVNRIQDKRIAILADRHHFAGQQVFEDYGDNSDTIYLTYHGFVPDVNPFRCAKFVGPSFVSLSSKLKKLYNNLGIQAAPSYCVSDSYELSQKMLGYFTGIAFNSSALKSCQKIANKTDIALSEVLKSCGFDRVRNFINNFLIYNQIKKISFPSHTETQIVAKPSMGSEEFGNVLKDGNSLETRTLNAISQWLEVSAPSYTTSLENDIKLYDNWNKPLELNENLHNYIALKYRIHQKVLWENFCRVYGSECHIFSFDPKDRKPHPVDDDEEEEELNSVIGPDIVQDDVNPKALSLQGKLIRFNDWFNEALKLNGSTLSINALRAVEIDGYRIGTVATRNISAEEVYLRIPSEIIIDDGKARNSPMGDLLNKLFKKYGKHDEYHDLLFYLLFEKFMRGRLSDYWPYLSLLPSSEDMLDVPTYWLPEDIHDRLYPSFVYSSVKSFRDRIFRMYDYVVNEPLIREFFPPEVLSFENYRWASAILDSRSIWWNNRRHLVPMLDFVNCKELQSNTSRVHRTALDPTRKYAETRAGTDFTEGEQVFENYGQPNYIYFQFHGFTLVSPDGVNENSHDCVHYEFMMEPAEEKRINKNGPIVKEILKSKRINSDLTMHACLKYPIEPDIWKFLALKMNQHKTLHEQNMLGKPTPEAVKYLFEMLQLRLQIYEEYNSKHYESKKFITSERKLLESIYNQLIADYIELTVPISEQLKSNANSDEL